jgi:hypothetical protein
MTQKLLVLILGVFTLSLVLGENLHAQSLVNPNATAEAEQLKVLLDSYYGKKILSGQVNEKWLSYIISTTGGKSPAIMGYDFNGICPSQGGNNDASKAIAWVKNKLGIAQFQWHWISPNADGDFYTKNYNLANALADTNSSSYKNLIRDMDLVAKELKKMQDAGVPILWRPLHEAEGKWFWWGMSGGDACKKLYRLMYDRYVNYYKLNNLIWIWNSYGATKENWYPGDDVVDIIAYDYPDYTVTTGSWSQYQKMFGTNGKLFGVGEDGKLTDPEVFLTQPWLYFLTWDYMIQEPSVTNGKNPKDWVFKVYNDPRVVTLDDLQPGLKADAGFNQTVYDNQGDGFEEVTLDGTGSYNDNGTIIYYEWKEGDTVIGQGEKINVRLSVGTHKISLTVTGSNLEFKTAYTIVSVRKITAATNKRVIATTTEPNSINIPAYAVDGDFTTRWSSAFSDPQWIAVDLGSSYDIETVILNWHTASARNYYVDISIDGVNWKVISNQTNKAIGARIDSLKKINEKARFVRMFGLERNTLYGYSLWEFEIYGKQSTAVETEKIIPAKFTLEQNFPNPFNPETVISYQLAEFSHVSLKIYDLLGNEIATLVNEYQQPGHYSSKFNTLPASHAARQSGRSTLTSGVYFYKLQADPSNGSGQSFVEVKKMMFVK